MPSIEIEPRIKSSAARREAYGRTRTLSSHTVPWGSTGYNQGVFPA